LHREENPEYWPGVPKRDFVPRQQQQCRQPGITNSNNNNNNQQPVDELDFGFGAENDQITAKVDRGDGTGPCSVDVAKDDGTKMILGVDEHHPTVDGKIADPVRRNGAREDDDDGKNNKWNVDEPSHDHDVSKKLDMISTGDASDVGDKDADNDVSNDTDFEFKSDNSTVNKTTTPTTPIDKQLHENDGFGDASHSQKSSTEATSSKLGKDANFMSKQLQDALQEIEKWKQLHQQEKERNHQLQLYQRKAIRHKDAESKQLRTNLEKKIGELQYELKLVQSRNSTLQVALEKKSKAMADVKTEKENVMQIYDNVVYEQLTKLNEACELNRKQVKIIKRQRSDISSLNDEILRLGGTTASSVAMKVNDDDEGGDTGLVITSPSSKKRSSPDSVNRNGSRKGQRVKSDKKRRLSDDGGVLAATGARAVAAATTAKKSSDTNNSSLSGSTRKNDVSISHMSPTVSSSRRSRSQAHSPTSYSSKKGGEDENNIGEQINLTAKSGSPIKVGLVGWVGGLFGSQSQ
jgi:hypothetical protein